MSTTTCETCGESFGVGDWPYCKSPQNPAGHTRPLEHHPFIPYWDHHISSDGKPVYIDSLAKQWSEMRRNKVDHADEKFARNHKERVERLRDEGRI